MMVGFIVAAILSTVLVIAVGHLNVRDLKRLKEIDVLNETLSYRVPPFLAAWRMFTAHPLVGVGPGCWSLLYFDYKIAVERDHPALFHSGQGWSNFGEVHNDHLEILAETGVPGYILFVSALLFSASHSFRTADRDLDTNRDLTRVARLLAFPVSAALFVLCLAQFPLQLASTTSAFAFVFATTLGWIRR
jgi:O-antigen ligase